MKRQWTCASLLLIWIALSACSTWPSHLSKKETRNELDFGYGALHQLLSDEQSVDKLLLIKSVSAPSKELIKSIAADASSALETLKSVKSSAPVVRTDQAVPLPVIEQAARDSIESQTARDLVFSSETFEVRVLMSQGQALRYGRFLAEGIANRDENSERSTWLKQLASRLEEHYEKVVEILQAKNQ